MPRDKKVKSTKTKSAIKVDTVVFHSLVTHFRLAKKKEIAQWITEIIAKEKREAGEINFIFCSDKYLLDMNRQYLDHDYYTDVITFDFNNRQKQKNKMIIGDIFISIDRVKDNAASFKIPVMDELLRVMIHGVLHLLGYNDKTKAQITVMRQKEAYYLSFAK